MNRLIKTSRCATVLLYYSTPTAPTAPTAKVASLANQPRCCRTAPSSRCKVRIKRQPNATSTSVPNVPWVSASSHLNQQLLPLLYTVIPHAPTAPTERWVLLLSTLCQNLLPPHVLHLLYPFRDLQPVLRPKKRPFWSYQPPLAAKKASNRQQHECVSRRLHACRLVHLLNSARWTQYVLCGSVAQWRSL